MTKKIKNMFYMLASTVLTLPVSVLAAKGGNAGAASSGYTAPSAPGGVPTATNANDLIMQIINWLLGLIGSLAVLMIVVAGVMYITSGGDGDRVDTAKKYLTYSVIGLVVALLGYVIVLTIGNAL